MARFAYTRVAPSWKHLTRSVQEQDELSFAAGDVIEIVAKTNNDWWMGKVHGKQALFPANYVEEIPDSSSTSEKSGLFASRSYGAGAHPAAEAPPSNPLGLQAAPGQEEKKKGFGKYKSTVSSSRSFRLQSCLSVSLSYQLAHSAAGGVGFGAGLLFRFLSDRQMMMAHHPPTTGAAIGGGLVRAIF